MLPSLRFLPRHPIMFGALLMLLTVSSECAIADGAETAEQWVTQLGSDSYAARQAAEAELSKLGVTARDELLTGLRSADPEVRRRCSRILAEVLDTDLKQRLQAFLADKDGDPPGLPGWNAFQAVVGDTAGGRELFAVLIKEESELLESIEADSEVAVQAWATSIARTLFGPNVRQRQPLNAAKIAALLLAGSQHAFKDLTTYQLASNLASQLMQPQFSKLLTEGDQKDAYRKLLAGWIQATSAPQLTSQLLMLVMRLNLREEGLSFPIRVLDDAKARSPREVAMAIEAVARLGGVNHASRLEPFLKDARPSQVRIVNKTRTEIQVRDIAMGWLIHVTKQNHADYGMPNVTQWLQQLERSPQLAFNFTNFVFVKPTRDAALEKWSEWSQAHPLAESPKVETKFSKAPRAKQDEIVKQTSADPIGSTKLLELRPADRTNVTLLTRARNAIEEERYVDATQALGLLLALDEDYYFQPERGVALYQQLRIQAEKLLAKLPSSGLRSYELRYGPIAQAALRNGLPRNRLETLREVHRKYFFTEAGSEAGYLLGSHHRTAGHPVQAAMHLERLSRLSPIAHKFEPALSLQLACCWRLAGLPDRASEALDKVAREYGNHQIRIGGKLVPMLKPGENQFVWLDRLMGPGLKLKRDSKFGWGPDAEAVPVNGGGPYLEAVSMTSGETPATVSKAIETVMRELRDNHQTALPVMQPLVVDDVVVFRDALGIQATDLGSREVRWKSPLMNGLWRLLRFEDPKKVAGQASFIVDGLRQQLWEDTAFGVLTSNGNLVFAVEDTSFELGPDIRTTIIRPDGRRQLDSASIGEHNQLVAYDVRTGKVKWELGGSRESLSPLSGGRFCGPPLCLGDYLYVVVEVQGQSLLVSLDATTGALLDRLLIDVFNEDVGSEEAIKVGIQQPVKAAPVPGSSPVFTDGVVICSTSKKRYVAVDLTSRTVRWAFAPPSPESKSILGAGVAQQMLLAQQARRDRSDQWSDFGPIVAGRFVLLTPWDGDKMYCLNADDGRALWSVPREDGLYVAGIHQNNAVVVRRSGIQTYRLTDGKEQLAKPVQWPAGAVPSGRGYLAADRLFVPLSSAEVAGVDLKSGKLVARSRAVDDVIPGNLVRVDDWVVSCTPTRVDRFGTLAAREAELLAKAAEPDADLQHFLKLTEVMLYQGKTEIVLERLRQKPQALESADGARLLAEAVIQSPIDDWKSHRELAAQVEESLADSDAHAEFLTRLIDVYQDAEEHNMAFAAAWRLVEVSEASDELIAISPAHTTRQDRHVQQTLAALLPKVSEQSRADYEHRIEQRLREKANITSVNSLGFHPAANHTRLKIAAQWMAEEKRLAAELLLRRVLADGTPSQQAEATAQLAILLREAGRSLEAARFYAMLEGPLANTVCLDEKLGKDLSDLPEQDPVQRWIRGNGRWQNTTPKTIVANSSSGQPTTTFPLLITSDGSALAPFASADINVQTRTIIGFDGQGAQMFSSKLETDGKSTVRVSNGVMNEGCASGHLLIAWLSGRVLAIDQMTGKTLWSRDTIQGDLNQWWLRPQLQRRMLLQRQMQQGAVPHSQLPNTVIATNDYVLFQEGRILMAVDPITGERIWSRDDLAASCELQGDREIVLATPGDSDTAIVLSAVDGRRLGTCQLPPKKQVLARAGRRFLTSNIDQNNIDQDTQTIELADPWKGKADWTKKIGAKAQTWPVDGGQLAILDPDGTFSILDINSGQDIIQGAVPAEPKLQNIIALRSNDRYFLIANRPEPPTAGNVRVINQNLPGQLMVEGNIHCIDAKTAECKWSHQVTKQAIRANYPPQAPLLTFFRRHQTMIKSGNAWRGGQPKVQVTCLDSSSGKVLHDSELSKSYDQSYGLVVDPKAGEVKIETRTQRLTFRYDDPDAN